MAEIALTLQKLPSEVIGAEEFENPLEAFLFNCLFLNQTQLTRSSPVAEHVARLEAVRRQRESLGMVC